MLLMIEKHHRNPSVSEAIRYPAQSLVFKRF